MVLPSSGAQDEKRDGIMIMQQGEETSSITAFAETTGTEYPVSNTRNKV
jgi:hypothetical protein